MIRISRGSGVVALKLKTRWVGPPAGWVEGCLCVRNQLLMDIVFDTGISEIIKLKFKSEEFETRVIIA